MFPAVVRIALAVGSAGVALSLGAVEPPADPKPPERFDLKVREDFFRGFGGDAESLARGMKKCEETLAKDPKHAEALVWHGSGLLFAAGAAFQKGDTKTGLEKWTQGRREMDEAVRLDPESSGTRVPRGVVYLIYSRFVPDEPTKKDLLDKAKEDLDFVLASHKGNLKAVGTHPRGELLFALAEAYRRTGDAAGADRFLRQIADLNRDTKYSREAEDWLNDPKRTTHTCIGCHKPGQ
jgi:hypothetical protein